MNYFIDRIILLLYCLLSLLFTEPGFGMVLACFAALIVSTINDPPRSPRFLLISVTAYTALSFFVPECVLFFPLIAYDYLTKEWNAHRAHFHLLWLLPLALPFFNGRLFAFFHAGPLFFLITGLLLSALLRFRTDSYEALRSRYTDTHDSDTEIRLLLEERNQTLLEKQDSEIYLATLRERNRIAREIHDNVGHMLTRAILMVGALRTVCREDALLAPLSQLEDTLNQAMNSIRQSVHDLHDSSVSLEETLQSLIQEFTFCPVTLHYSMSPYLPREVKYSFISIVQEALVNISRHSDAKKASVTVQEHPGFYQLIISDDGTTARAAKQSRFFADTACGAGIGLKNMQNRVRSLDGNFRLDTRNGFCIHITVPRKVDEV